MWKAVISISLEYFPQNIINKCICQVLILIELYNEIICNDYN